MKKITIKVAGREGMPQDIGINPGTTPRDICRQLNLIDYKLSKDSQVIDDAENIYQLVSDGDKIFATTNCEVGK